MDSNLLFSHFTSAAVFVMLMQRLKMAPWFPWLKMEGQVWQKRLASIATALGVHLGISHVWNPSTNGAHVLIITVPALSVVAVGAWHWLGQFALQETMYQAVSNKAATAVPPATKGGV
jgi:hypothetical protein